MLSLAVVILPLIFLCIGWFASTGGLAWLIYIHIIKPWLLPHRTYIRNIGREKSLDTTKRWHRMTAKCQLLGLLIKSMLTDWPQAYSCLHQMQGKICYVKSLSMKIRPRAHMVNYYSSVEAQYFAKSWYCKMSKPCVLVSTFCEVSGGLFNVLLQHFICNTNFSF